MDNHVDCSSLAPVGGHLEWSVGVESGVESGVSLWSVFGVKNWSQILELIFGVEFWGHVEVSFKHMIT
jgi:hypothetical protein